MAGAVHKAVLEASYIEEVYLGRAGVAVADQPLDLWVLVLVDLAVGVAQLDHDVPLELILEPDCVDVRC